MSFRIYPLQGVIATAEPSLVIAVKMRNVSGNSGPVNHCGTCHSAVRWQLSRNALVFFATVARLLRTAL
jgi:hypothetical protein